MVTVLLTLLATQMQAAFLDNWIKTTGNVLHAAHKNSDL
jgi:hypothetical protein